MPAVVVGDIMPGDVIRLEDDRQALRVVQVLHAEDGRVSVRLQPVGLAVESVVRALPVDSVVERLASGGSP